MAITQKFKSMDNYFRSLPGDKLLVNDLNFVQMGDLESIDKNLITEYSNPEIIPTIPSCDCGNYSGRYLVGVVCPQCNTTCKEVDEKVEPILWLKTIDPSIKFINPNFWRVLSRLIAKSKTEDWLRYLADPNYNPNKIPTHVMGMKEVIGGVRSYEAVCENIPNLIKYMMEHSRYKRFDKQLELNRLLEIYTIYKDDIYSEYLPIINKKLFVIENTVKGRFVNFTIAEILDVVMAWSAAAHSQMTKAKMLNITATTLGKLCQFYSKIDNDYIATKSGIFRKHIYGARSPNTFRSVITSISGPHDYDEIHIPWIVGVTIFRPHILNRLMRMGKTYKEANKLLFQVVKRYDPLVDKILNDLIEESPYKGVPCIAQRNPSLKQGSTILVYITKVQTNVEIKTVSISSLIAKFPNADFDGDELNFTMMLDNFLTEEMKTFSAYYNIPDGSAPYAISPLLTLLAPGNILLSNYLRTPRSPGEDTVYHKLKIRSTKI